MKIIIQSVRGVGNYKAHRLNGGLKWVPDGAHQGTSRHTGSIMFTEHVDYIVLHMHKMVVVKENIHPGCAVC
jgi:hypothetical protein